MQGKFKKSDVFIDGEKITVPVVYKNGCAVVDASRKYLAPGLIDIHVHGAYGSDFCDGSEAALDTISKYLASVGVTSFLGTSITYDANTLRRVFKNVGIYAARKRDARAVLHGVSMDPFFPEKKRRLIRKIYYCP